MRNAAFLMCNLKKDAQYILAGLPTDGMTAVLMDERTKAEMG